VHGGISGLIHFTGEGVPGSWADLAEYVLALTGSKTNVTRVDSDTYARGSSRPIATRPINSVLALDRAREAGLPLHDWRERVAAYVADLGGRRR
jgi:dTDP-4-dehydrorhamnose reductase